jgi:hypothetical protein
MKDFLTSTCFVICFLLSVLICTTALNNSILYISQQAIAQPMPTSSPTTSSHNILITSNSTFLTFQNKGTLGIMIKYPFNWKRIVADDKVLIFLPPSKEDKFSENLVVALFDINSSISASQLSDQAISKYGEHYSDFFIIDLKPIIFKGDPAYTLLYTYTNPAVGKITAMDIGIKGNNKAYVISYSAEQPEYHTYLPVIEKMIDSFRMIS